VFGVAQAACADRAGIARTPRRLVFTHRLNPVDDLLTEFGLRVPLRLLRRHGSRLESFHDGLPAAVVLRVRLPGWVRAQVPTALSLFSSVRLQAVGLCQEPGG